MAEKGVADRFYLGHLRWTSHGEVWATWRLAPLQRSRTEKTHLAVRGAHAALLRACVGHDVLLEGVLTWTDSADLVERMTRGIDLVDNPQWAAECDAKAEQLSNVSFGQRRFYLSVRLTPSTMKGRVTTWGRSALSGLLESVGLNGVAPGGDEIATYTAAAEVLEENLPEVFDPVRASEAELVWLRRQSQTRSDAAVDPVQAPELAEELLEVSGRAAVGEPLLDPNALTDLTGDAKGSLARRRALFRRRVLKVIADTGEECYQSGLVLSRIPKQMTFPRYEFLGRIDDAGIPLNYAMRMTVRTRTMAIAKNKSALQRLNDQLNQVEGADVGHASHMIRTQDSADNLADYATTMQRDEQEVEVEPIVMASTAGDDMDSAVRDASAFVRYQAGRDFAWARPVGAESKIFWGMQPASNIGIGLRDYRQLSSSMTVGSAAPLTTHFVGSESGIPIGINIESPLSTPWFIDLFGDATDSETGQSPTLFAAGEQGAGKSALLKTLAAAIVDRGGRMIATDVSHTREWFTLVNALDCTKAMVDVAEPEMSCDPLRTMGHKSGGAAAQAFLVTLLNVAVTDPEGVCIARAVKPRYLEENGIDSMQALYLHLRDDSTDPAAADVAGRMEVFTDVEASGSIAAAIFDPELPAMNLDARAIVFGTSTLSLPTHEELADEHRYRVLPLEKILGRAVYALIVRMSTQVSSLDSSDPAGFFLDELHHATPSPEAVAALSEFIRYGRRDLAALLTGTHDPEADIPKELRQLIKNRIVMRQPDGDLAKAGARLLGYAPEDDAESYEAVVRQILDLPLEAGYGVVRDSRRNVARVRVLLPARADRRAAVLSTPNTKQAA